MVEQRQAQPRGRLLRGVLLTGEDHRPTTLELLFDLVYVFAITQITGYMASEHSAHGVLQGLLLLTLLWGTWSSYTWLGNQARADEGLLRAGMVVAMATMFVIALTIPEAWRDAPGGLNGPLVLVCAYLLVRCVHLTVYAVVATGDPGRGVKSRSPGCRRSRVRPCWCPGRCWVVAGIVFAALGVEGVLAHAAESKALGAFYALPLFGGVALYLAGLLLFINRMHSPLSLPRVLATCVLLAVLPAVVVLRPLAGLVGLVVILTALIVVETTRYAQARRSIRGA